MCFVSLMDVVCVIVCDEGVFVFICGMSVCVFFYILVVVICWTTYEVVKRVFGLDGDDVFGYR